MNGLTRSWSERNARSRTLEPRSHRFSGAQVAKAIPSRWRARHRRAEQLARTRRIGRPPLGRPARELIAIRVDRDRKYEMGDEGDGCFYDLLRLPTARRGAARHGTGIGACGVTRRRHIPRRHVQVVIA